MVKEAIRHETRTCDGNGKRSCVRLFGVNIVSSTPDNQREPRQQQQPIQKSLSLGNLQALDQEDDSADHGVEAGYLSDGPVVHSRRGKAAHERKKGKPWTGEEHRTFLAGLKKLGKGDWRGISKKFVTSRTPTQVASHAQKYFIRHTSTDKKKRRPSVFDLPLSEPAASAPKATPNLPPVNTAKPLSKASNSSVLLSNNVVETQANAITAAQIMNCFPNLCLDQPPIISPASPAVNWKYYYTTPYLQAISGRGQSSFGTKIIPAASPFVHHIMKHSRIDPTLSNINQNAIACAPVIAHPSGIPSPRPLQHGVFESIPQTSTPSLTEKDPLELKLDLLNLPKEPIYHLGHQTESFA
ncbi:protein REVEILLE 4 [Tripterygium wilfordii]|uniref:Protein REVEILLE 4 n=1 Tax=Tripterygium wilfordii TaxID=458696 RepID=A0A7J7CA65_TRIWF|nr:probable transcription factor At5g61620 [Tripterygium wilfordii]KAF5731038.1 protein REVEILLE 4 [Tripterygium wilfordii]